MDGCDCAAILRLIAEDGLDVSPLITHVFPLAEADRAFALFESGADGVMKVAIKP